ncbi:leucyl aminopeptidase [Allostreptomyces psammosilenae]|uniref:Probable cytosol aminopeptidase n=1 Tax=Allostreptomyces psammosilenae TaxID=1892865 RepID=A0A852ZYV0_9ACTN|nr:leucyl aminopeptidase [Allostreptomyces psammosilenae]NYI06997.1 leucyl aminopeptidase [Allostreptomyces psammosilenae]
MTTLTLSSSTASSLPADVVVVGLAKGEQHPVLAPGAESVDEAFGGRLATVLETLGATGAEGETTLLPAAEALKAPVVLAVGLGEAPGGDDADAGTTAPGEYAAETLRRAAGSAARALAGRSTAVLALPTATAEAVEAVGLGTLLGAYSFDTYRAAGGDESAGRGRKAPLGEAVIVVPGAGDDAVKVAVDRATVIGEEMCRARDLVNTAPNDLYPEVFARIATEAGQTYGLDVEVLDEAALTEGGYGGILGVGRGSQRPPRLVRVAYTAPGAERTVAFVGKGITYDSGGISLKPAGHNETMKCDMSGAAAVLSAVISAARLGLAVNVTGWLALAENMPSGSATRPGDVLRMYGGKTVEVLNTDAEGRLVLADALTRAGEEGPDVIVDVATLTGAMILALGTRTFGVMANDDDFRAAVHATAERVGEPSWPMPLPEHLRKGMVESTVADLANMGERMGGGLVAGLFLREFVADGITWAHLDIAGPAFNESGPFGYTPKGGTGSAVRTLVALAEQAAGGELPLG